MKFEYDNRLIACISCTKFLRITVESTLYWKSYLVNFYQNFVMVYYAYFHSSMNYDIIFWGNSPYSINIFRLQKRQLELLQILGIHVDIHLKH